MLKDGLGRELTYLRISLTDKCNLRCRYCVPPCGVKLKEHKDILTLEETQRLVDIFTKLGVNKVRFTGGEPLVRKNAVGLIKNVSKLTNAPHIFITTNGVLLEDYIDYLCDASVKDINISLDTLDPSVFESITGSDSLSSVIEGIRSCLVRGINLKINTVPLKGINENEIPALAGLARDNDLSVRFIELMPIGCAASYEGISNDEVKRRLIDVYGQGVKAETEGGGPAEYMMFEGFRGKVGFISPISHSFCLKCNRLRLTCDGQLKLCLASPVSVDLKSLIRSGASDEDISATIIDAVKNKPSHHEFSSGVFDPGNSGMIGIGG